MEAPAEPVSGEPVVAINSDEDAAAFAEVQSAAFLDADDPEDDWRRTMFLEMAVQNHRARRINRSIC